MKRYKRLIILLNLVLLLIYFNYSVIKKEVSGEQLILLELAPDPRSVDPCGYIMSHSYKISENMDYDNMPKQGYCVVRLNKNGIANSVRFQEGLTPLHKGEHLIRYTSPDKRSLHIGDKSFQKIIISLQLN